MALRRFGAALGTAAVILAVVMPVVTSGPSRSLGLSSRASTLGARAALRSLPLSFEPAAPGSPARYLARGPDYAVFLTDTGSVLSLSRGDKRVPAVLRTTLAGARPGRPRAEDRQRGIVNVLKGPKRDWREGIHTYGRVRYASIYPGIDAVYHGRRGALEYDFQIAAGADPSQISLRMRGERSLRMRSDGTLVILMAGGAVSQAPPVAYQQRGGRRVPVRVGFRVNGDRVGFRLGSYDRSLPLVIDPVLSYASYLGGAAADEPERIAAASDGSLFVVGSTTSNNFPRATARTSGRTDYDAFITHLDPTGTILWSTYLGGSGTDKAHDVAIDLYGDPIIVGETSSGSGFSTDTSLDPSGCSNGGVDAWEAQISTAGGTGIPYYQACFGGAGNDVAYGVTTRYVSGITTGRLEVLIAGSSTSASGFPIVNGSSTANGGSEAFLVQARYFCRTATGCNSFDFGTFWSTSDNDVAADVAVDGSGNAYITGTSTNTGALTWQAFVSKINPYVSTPTAPVYSTTLAGGSGSNTAANAIAVSSAGVAYVAGQYYTTHLVTSDLPGSGNLQFFNGEGNDGFVSVLNSSGTPTKAIYIGSSGTSDQLNDIALSENGGVVSFTATGMFDGARTAVNGLTGQSCSSGDKQVVVVKEADAASGGNNTTPIYLTCLGGSSSGGDYGTGVALGPNGSVWVTGRTGAFPATGDAAQGSFGGGADDGFLAQISPQAPAITSGPSGAVASADATFGFQVESGMTAACSDASGGDFLSTRSAASCTGTGTTTYTGLNDGPHTFAVSAKDAGGTDGPVATRSFTVDTTPPSAFDLTSPADGASTGTQPGFTWTTPADATELTFQLIVDGQDIQDVPASACSNGTCSATAATSLLGGAHRWKVVAADAAGNTTSSSSERSFSVADPPTAKLVVSPNPALAKTVVTFDGSGSADARHTIAKYEWDFDGDGNFDSDTGATAKTSHSYDSPGEFNVGLRVTDTAGLTSTTTVPLKISSLPTGSTQLGVSINKGAQYTNHPAVTLTIVAPASSTGLLISNDGGFMGALPQPVQQEVPWTLDSSGPERLPKTVYVRFLTGTFASPNYTDDIILDERPPVVDSASVVGGSAGASIAKLRTWKVRVKAHDTNSGVGGVQVAVSKKKPGKLLKYAAKVSVKLSSRPKFIRARDRAGNFSPWKKLR